MGPRKERTLAAPVPLSTALLLTVVLLWSFAATPTAWSRPWKPSARALAQDYAVIVDSRNNHDIRMLFWLAPPMLSGAKSQQVFDKYIVIGVARERLSIGSSPSFDEIDTLEAKDNHGKPLQLLGKNDMPPAVIGALATMEAVLARSLGPMGKGTHWFVFDGGTVHACGKGGMSISFAGEIYTYETPVPGCSSG